MLVKAHTRKVKGKTVRIRSHERSSRSLLNQRARTLLEDKVYGDNFKPSTAQLREVIVDADGTYPTRSASVYVGKSHDYLGRKYPDSMAKKKKKKKRC